MVLVSRDIRPLSSWTPLPAAKRNVAEPANSGITLFEPKQNNNALLLNGRHDVRTVVQRTSRTITQR